MQSCLLMSVHCSISGLHLCLDLTVGLAQASQSAHRSTSTAQYKFLTWNDDNYLLALHRSYIVNYDWYYNSLHLFFFFFFTWRQKNKICYLRNHNFKSIFAIIFLKLMPLQEISYQVNTQVTSHWYEQ